MWLNAIVGLHNSTLSGSNWKKGRTRIVIDFKLLSLFFLNLGFNIDLTTDTTVVILSKIVDLDSNMVAGRSNVTREYSKTFGQILHSFAVSLVSQEDNYYMLDMLILTYVRSNIFLLCFKAPLKS